MSSYIDIKYLNIISPQLQKFKKKGDNLWNFRCPYCGDSQKNKTKARGFVYQKKNDLFFKCHNCDVGTTVGKLIEYLDSKTYKDYIMERYKTGSGGTKGTITPKPEFKFNAPVFRKKDIFKSLKSIAELDSDHPARKIVERRTVYRKSPSVKRSFTRRVARKATLSNSQKAGIAKMLSYLKFRDLRLYKQASK
jgi:transcription elongation factor Elf1